MEYFQENMSKRIDAPADPHPRVEISMGFGLQ
jgi:hypothetical protein